MDYRIAVVDDTRSDREKLASDIAAWFRGKREVEVNAFPNAESMLRSFIPGRYRIAFIDIIMPEENGASRGENGIALATRLKAMDSKLLVIFYTTSREYVFDAFSIHPFDYLVKPYDPMALSRVLTDALSSLDESEAAISVRVDRSIISLPLSQIMSASSQAHSVEVVTAEGVKLRTNTTFSDFEKHIGGDRRFLLCNRGVMVNMDFVLTVENGSFRMINGDIFTIKTKGRGDIMNLFTQYQFEKLKRK